MTASKHNPIEKNLLSKNGYGQHPDWCDLLCSIVMIGVTY